MSLHEGSADPTKGLPGVAPAAIRNGAGAKRVWHVYGSPGLLDTGHHAARPTSVSAFVLRRPAALQAARAVPNDTSAAANTA